MIDSRDITFVVQGAIVGKSFDKKDYRHTYLCLQSIRKYFPNSTIILSTWDGSDVKDLDFDLLIENKDPGASILGDFSQNGFRQIVSSVEGLKKVSTKYTVKVRSDLIFKSSNFIKYFEKYNKIAFDNEYKILKKRVLMLLPCNPNRRFKFPYNAADWFYFGLREDVLNIFDIPLIYGEYIQKHEYDNNKEKRCISPYSGEQYIWFTFLSKYKNINFLHLRDVTNNNIQESEKYFANNAVLVTARMAGVNWLKYPGAAYAQIPCLSNSGLYTFTEYKRMLNNYTPSKLLICPNVFESLLYLIVYNLRFFVKEKNIKLYAIISSTINRRNHKRLKDNGIDPYKI